MTAGPSLTPEQRAAVEASDGPYVVVAPPGSGKTEVLVRRVLWLVARSAGEPFRLLALTYTNKAAEELRTRAGVVLGEETWRVTATTLHAFCVDMLQRYGEPVGVLGDVSVYDTDDLRLDVLDEALAGAGYETPGGQGALRDLLAKIDELRLQLHPPDLVPDEPALGGRITVPEAYRAYEDALTDAQAIDFPGMLFRGWLLLTEDPWVGMHYRRQYRHVLLDEAQDLTYAQVEILRVLCGDELRNIFIVADDDQEIFSFAGASSEHYAGLAEEIGARQLPLTTNFRSAESIVDAAERLREHFHTIRVRRVSMTTSTPAPGWVGATSFPGPDEEGEGIAAWIAGLLRDHLPAKWLHEGEDPRLQAEQICIMARTRWAFDPVLAALDRRGLDYVMRTEEGGLFDSTAGRGTYLWLRVLANPRDRASARQLESLLDEGAPGVRVSEGTTPFHGPDSGGSGADGSALRSLASRLELPDGLIEVLECAVSAEAPTRLLEPVVATIPADHSTGGGWHVGEADLWAADQTRLANHWERYAALTRVSDRTLAGFLRQLSRLQRTPPDAPGVRLLTPYRAKGLQFRAVVVAGMSEGGFPHYRATSEREVDEERRAVYVAVTRAARAVLLTRPEQRLDRWGRVHRARPSRFLDEMGIRA